MIGEGRGRHFDPSLVDCFMENTDEFRYIASRFSDDIDEGSSNE
jgi:response regulator RpfG family c-di-GMP phosphodiesterase